jgi:sugar phosphate isomerase/epimerase
VISAAIAGACSGSQFASIVAEYAPYGYDLREASARAVTRVTTVPRPIPKGLTAEHVLLAPADLDARAGRLATTGDPITAVRFVRSMGLRHSGRVARPPHHPFEGSMNPREPGPIALQLWTIRGEMASDADRALRRVKEAGFAAVELAPLPTGLTPDHLAELLVRHDLAVVSIHGDLPTPATIGLWTGLARACRCPGIIWHGWPRDPRFDSLAGVRDLIAACNSAGAIARDHGLRFGLHNHWWEFEPIEGERPIRLLRESLHPEIFWQLDVYWAQTGGADPAAMVVELGTRLGSLHLKDGPAVHGEPMTALGRGKVDIPGILRALAHPADRVIELDECATDPLEAARQGLAHLESLRTT